MSDKMHDVLAEVSRITGRPNTTIGDAIAYLRSTVEDEPDPGVMFHADTAHELRNQLANSCGWMGEDEDEYPEWDELLTALHAGFCKGPFRAPMTWSDEPQPGSKAEATIAMLREALAEANRRTTEARIAASDEEPWVWSDDDDINETVEGFGHMMVVRITGGHLRALIRDGRAKAEPMETRRWWVDGETFTEANDAASARLAANDAVTDAHASAVSDREWPEHVERISWGYTVTVGEATETEPDEDGATEWTVADMENDR